MADDLNASPYSRGMGSVLGPCGEAFKVYLPMQAAEDFMRLASSGATNRSDLTRDLIFKLLYKRTYVDYVAESRRRLIDGEGPIEGPLRPAAQKGGA